MPIGPFFVDFLCREQKLVVELDGASHDARQDEDARRDSYLRTEGHRVLRFQNVDIMKNLDGGLIALSQALDLPIPGPSRKREGREEK